MSIAVMKSMAMTVKEMFYNMTPFKIEQNGIGFSIDSKHGAQYEVTVVKTKDKATDKSDGSRGSDFKDRMMEVFTEV